MDERKVYENMAEVFDYFYEMLGTDPVMVRRLDGKVKECANFGEARDFFTEIMRGGEKNGRAS